MGFCEHIQLCWMDCFPVNLCTFWGRANSSIIEIPLNKIYAQYTSWTLRLESDCLSAYKKLKQNVRQIKPPIPVYHDNSVAQSVATALTISSSVSRVTLKMSPCSVWARKKNMDLVLCVAEQTKIMPLSGSSRSFWVCLRRKEVIKQIQNI